MGVKQHFVRLGEVSHQHVGQTGSELGMRHLQMPAQSVNDHVFADPVKLEGFAELKAQGDEAGVAWIVVQRLPEVTTVDVDLGWATAVAHGLDVRVKPLILEGDVPSPSRLPGCCTFHKRWPLVQPICRTQRPELREVAHGQNAACHFAAANPIPA